MNTSIFTAIDKLQNEFWWRKAITFGGFDVGKRGNPSHCSIFAILEADIDDDGEEKFENDKIVMIHQKFLDNWEYTRQVDYLTALIDYFNIRKLYYDNTRGELEERSLPRECIPIILSNRTGPRAKGKMELATNFAKLVEQKRMILLDEDRFISQITCVTSGTKIWTKGGGGYRNNRRGYQNIEDIKVGTLVKTHKNRYRKVTHIFERFINEEIIELKLDNNLIINITKNHPVLTTKGWKNAGELTTNDILMKVINFNAKINRPLKGQTFEEYYGEEKGKNIKLKISNSNKNKHSINRIIWVCPVCGKEIYLTSSKAKVRKFCSRHCEGIFYAEDSLLREGWGGKGEKNSNYNPNKIFRPYGLDFTFDLRKRIRERDNYKCQLCGKNGFSVHHIDYDKINSSEENLITLCNSCHSKTTYTKKLEYYKNIFQAKILLIYNKTHNGLNITRLINKFYSGKVYNLEVEEDQSYVGKGIIFHNCVTGDLQAPNTPRGHGDSFISIMLAVGVFYDYYASDRRMGTSSVGNVQDIVDSFDKSTPTSSIGVKRDLNMVKCVICGNNQFDISPNGLKKVCTKCFTIW